MRNLLGIVGTLWFASLADGQHLQPKAATRAVEIGSGFDSRFAQVNGTRLHYVRGGTGPALILIHGFPQDWSEYRPVMPRLAKQFTVIAIDLRGIGGSSPSTGGYDAPTMAEDIYQLVSTLGLHHVYVVGHDIGGHVAYAFVRRYPQITRGAMILDTLFPERVPARRKIRSKKFKSPPCRPLVNWFLPGKSLPRSAHRRGVLAAFILQQIFATECVFLSRADEGA